MIDFISNLILKLIPIKSMPYWIALIVILLIICAVALLIEIPKIVGNNIKQKKEFKSSHQLQIESYFRDISGSKLEEIFSTWTDALISEDTFSEFTKEKENVASLIKSTVMYGSNRTLSLAALLMQYIYKQDSSNNSNDSDDGIGLMGLAMLAELISSLKSDFSGYKVLPQLILEIKYNDWDEIKKEMMGYLTEIEEQVDS